MILTANDKYRFLAYVFNKDPNECWPWLGATSDYGYGYFRLNGKTLPAHRIAYFLKYGVDPSDLFICHHCDNPPCCNPGHLFLGTQHDNLRDASKKDLLGKHGGNVKLTEENVIEIKQLLCLGLLQCDIAKRFNVTIATISAINTKKLWSHIQ